MDLSTFLTRKDLILLDGAMGTQLAERGAVMGGQSTISHPDQVLAIHKNYVQCGCHILITNTFAMNRVYIETHKIGVDVREVNVSGVQLAKQAVGHNQYILGDMSSTGKLLEPYGDLKESAAYEAFAEQAALLQEGGADGFIIETMTDLKEALCALRACKEVSALPVIVTMAFSSSQNGGRTIMGNAAKECATALTEAGAEAVGANCGDIDPFQMAEIVSVMRSGTELPLLAKPNAGRPRMVDHKTVFDMSPPEFAKGIMECISAGATMVGGCCGTSPEHICALADATIKGK
ncbi:MAG: homocysteine S-methyltransferase family protein [Deltaproteobacteria bacterium]|nr:homocysteine S-methyltransferase family protein [Deltaproteobacteria bacterium]